MSCIVPVLSFSVVVVAVVWLVLCGDQYLRHLLDYIFGVLTLFS